VDRAFIYPPLALDGINGLGRAGVALVAPGRRPGVGSTSTLAETVLDELKEKASFTSNSSRAIQLLEQAETMLAGA